MYKRYLVYFVVAVLGTLHLCGQALGADEAKDRSIEVRKLLLTPAAEPVPAMAYRLLPRHLDQKTGNAALLYNSAAALCPDKEPEDVHEKIDQWRDLPVDQLPRTEVEKALSSFSNSFHYVALAAQRADCQWEMPIEDGYSMQLPHLAPFRRMIFAMQLQIRLKIADGQTDQAMELLQQGVYMGRSIARGRTVVQGLVGTAITAVMLREVEGVMQRPDSANLYWALAALPEPMIDMYSSLEYEREVLFIEFPQLRDLENEVLTPAQASAVVSEFMSKIAGLSGGPDRMAFQGILPIGWVMMHYSDAKQFLAGRGFSQQRIETMPAAQAVLIYQKQEYLEMLDNLFKWFAFPYHQSRPYLEQGEKQIGEHHKDRGLKTNLFTVMFPALYRIAFIQARLDRHIAMLQTIEAIRLFAADNSGRLPGSLADIAFVPIPTDPVTGEGFLYRRTDARNARLEAPVSPAESRKRPVYELTLRR